MQELEKRVLRSTTTPTYICIDKPVHKCIGIYQINVYINITSRNRSYKAEVDKIDAVIPRFS